MDLFRRIVLAAVLVGAVAGLVDAGLQQWRLVPLILQAEAYESLATHEHASAPDQVATGQAEPAHTHDLAAWTPAPGLERTFYTFLATVLSGIGFALVLAALSVFLDLPLTLANGALWGLGGFLTVSLAPAFGLPPELPGMAAAALGARQMWWWFAVLATGAGLLGIAKFRSAPAIGIGCVLIAIPHIAGAPVALVRASDLPAELASQFAASALTIAMVFWLVTGAGFGWLNERFKLGETR